MKLPVLLLATFLLALSTAAQVRVGVAQVKITPPDGTPLAGYYSARGSTGVLDDLHAKALVFESGGELAAVVVCDLISLPRHTVVSARELIALESKVPPANVLMGATHQHTGPVLARESEMDSLTGGDTDLSKTYTAQLPKWIAEAVAKAEKNLQSVTVSAGRTEEHEIAFNRRFWMKDGTVSWNPAKNDPNIIRPAGPIDPEVLVVYAEAEKAKAVLTYVNFAMHPDTTGGTAISADYPGALARALAAYKGDEMVCIFANGCCGNINHRHITWNGPQTSQAEATRLGTVLAGDVLALYPNLKPIKGGKVRMKTEMLQLPLAPISDEDLKKSQDIKARANDPKVTFMEKVKAFQVLDVHAREGKPLEVEVQVIALGRELAFVSLPGEIFVELGLSIKKVSPFSYTSLVELANGSIGYIPNKPAYLEGNYEVISARCAAGSGEMLVTSAIKSLNELHSAAEKD